MHLLDFHRPHWQQCLKAEDFDRVKLICLAVIETFPPSSVTSQGWILASVLHLHASLWQIVMFAARDRWFWQGQSFIKVFSLLHSIPCSFLYPCMLQHTLHTLWVSESAVEEQHSPSTEVNLVMSFVTFLKINFYLFPFRSFIHFYFALERQNNVGNKQNSYSYYYNCYECVCCKFECKLIVHPEKVTPPVLKSCLRVNGAVRDTVPMITCAPSLAMWRTTS